MQHVAASSSPAPELLSSDPADADTAINTPPSSPPPSTPYDIAAVSCLTKSRTNAFSLLGKRKRPLSFTDGNARSTKKTMLSNKRNEEERSQTHLSLGQAIEKRCKECGMVYVACSAEDRALHDIYHKQLYSGYDVGRAFSTKAFRIDVRRQRIVEDERICVVTSCSPAWQKKHARNVLNIMTSCLGAVEITDDELWRLSGPDEDKDQRYEMYMLLRGTICAAAALIELPQCRARQVLPPISEMNSRTSGSARERLKQRREQAVQQLNVPLRISEKYRTTLLGVSRIWTAPDYRKQGLALLLLESIYVRHCKDTYKKLEDVSFSQPTAAGTRLARKFFEQQYGWLTY